ESGLGISLFRDNSTRTRFSFASACNLLGLEVQDLDEGKSQIAHGETVRETANMISFMADVIGIRARAQDLPLMAPAWMRLFHPDYIANAESVRYLLSSSSINRSKHPAYYKAVCISVIRTC